MSKSGFTLEDPDNYKATFSGYIFKGVLFSCVSICMAVIFFVTSHALLQALLMAAAILYFSLITYFNILFAVKLHTNKQS